MLNVLVTIITTILCFILFICFSMNVYLSFRKSFVTCNIFVYLCNFIHFSYKCYWNFYYIYIFKISKLSLQSWCIVSFFLTETHCSQIYWLFTCFSLIYLYGFLISAPLFSGTFFNDIFKYIISLIASGSIFCSSSFVSL